MSTDTAISTKPPVLAVPDLVDIYVQSETSLTLVMENIDREVLFYLSVKACRQLKTLRYNLSRPHNIPNYHRQNSSISSATSSLSNDSAMILTTTKAAVVLHASASATPSLETFGRLARWMQSHERQWISGYGNGQLSHSLLPPYGAKVTFKQIIDLLAATCILYVHTSPWQLRRIIEHVFNNNIVEFEVMHYAWDKLGGYRINRCLLKSMALMYFRAVKSGEYKFDAVEQVRDWLAGDLELKALFTNAWDSLPPTSRV